MSEDELGIYGVQSEFSESMVWMETILRQKAETLILKNGERIKGIIISEDCGYLLFTPSGRRIFRFEEVLGKES